MLVFCVGRARNVEDSKLMKGKIKEKYTVQR